MHRSGKRQRGFLAFCVPLFVFLLLPGCLDQFLGGAPSPTPLYTPPEVSPEVASSPSPSVSVSATPISTPNATALPSPSINASPSPTVSNTSLAGECTLAANPQQAQGPFKAALSVRFFNVVPPSNVTIKCSPNAAAGEAEKKGEFFVRVCDYGYALQRTLLFASASASGVSCTTPIVVDVNPAYSKGWSFSPQDVSLTLNKSIANTTRQNYTVSNTGALSLTSFSCSSDQSFASITCVNNDLKPGEHGVASVSLNVTSLSTGQQQAIITVREADLQQALSVTINVVS